jgi:glycine cleavage system H protein
MNDKKKLKILVVDDEITVCKSIRQAIVSEEYEVDMALSGEEALKKTDANGYDLVITDLMMPGISGLDLLKSLKETRPDIIIITPAELRGLVSRALKKAAVEGRGEEKAQEPRIPPGYYYMLGHTWLKLEEQNRATVGVVPDFLKTIGIINQVELPKENDALSQGDVCGKITDSERFVHRVWSPASGRVMELNTLLAADPSLLRRDPFQGGYLFRIETGNLEEDLQGLLLAR